MKNFLHLSMAEFNNMILSMTPIKNVPGVNEKSYPEWFIDEDANIIHIIKIFDENERKRKHYDITVCKSTVSKDAHSKDSYIRVFCEGTKLLHRIMASTFFDVPYHNVLDVHHKNHDRRDCELSNLELLTHSAHMAVHYKDKREGQFN